MRTIDKPILIKEDIRKLPPLYSTENDSNPISQIYLYCYFSPRQFWLIQEYCPERRLAFGWSDLGHGMGEMGYISLPEIESLEGRYIVEIDRSWEPKPLSQALIEIKKRLLVCYGEDTL